MLVPPEPVTDWVMDFETLHTIRVKVHLWPCPPCTANRQDTVDDTARVVPVYPALCAPPHPVYHAL